MDEITLVRQQNQSGGISIQTAHRLQAHSSETIRQNIIDGLMVASVMAAFHIQRLVHHDVQFFNRGSFFPIHDDGFGTGLKLNKRIIQNVSVQFHHASADESAGFLTGAKAN